MAYPALVTARRLHYEIDGTVVGFNQTGNAGDGMATILSGATMLSLNEETPSAGGSTLFQVDGAGGDWIYFIFPEAVDIDHALVRVGTRIVGGSIFIQGSTDTTNGADGTWNTCAGSGSCMAVTDASDWWRATAPVALTTNNTGLKGLRISVRQNIQQGPLENIMLWGHKHSGETPDDIVFLESDASTEWPNDDDWGDVTAGASPVTHTVYVKNVSGTKTANSITIKVSGSDNPRWTVSLDNVSFASSKAITSLAPGASQVVYWKFTPPTFAGGVVRPHASYLEADVTSWT